MSRTFCTLKEAAERLGASEDQIQALLDRGILREFREGSHRLLKEADVGVLASVGERRASAPPASWPTEVQPPSLSPRVRPKASRSAGKKRTTEDGVVGGCYAVVDEEQGAAAPPLATADYQLRTADYRAAPSCPGRSSCDPRRRRSTRAKAPARPAFPGSPRLSVRQWFWMGLVQDRPVVIALLSSLVLLALSALVAGLCFVAEAF